ncbi:MAG: nucleotidyltransferase family protein [Lactobacillales bacterium]|jgi:predicted nucleotidyltransferase|nr:nucleotidyltransferase family protein [Lactobacillales bacterium]
MPASARKIVGIVAEFNPFHAGHKYLIEQVRASGADAVIAVVGGNYTQRGEFSIVDKWAKTQMALEGGVDVVLELPVQFTLNSADYFARGAVEILEKAGCTHLAFGTESDFDYAKFGEFYRSNTESILREFELIEDPRLSYTEKMKLVYEKLYPEFEFEDNTPNHVLALSYAKFTNLELMPIKRVGEGYHSASAIREKLLDGTETIEGAHINRVVGEFEAVRFLLARGVRNVFQVDDGLLLRLTKNAENAKTLDELIELTKSRNYSASRVRRALKYILLGISEMPEHTYLRLLGMNEIGKAVMREVEYISNVRRNEAELLELEIKADRIFNLMTDNKDEQNFSKYPIIRPTVF